MVDGPQYAPPREEERDGRGLTRNPQPCVSHRPHRLAGAYNFLFSNSSYYKKSVH